MPSEGWRGWKFGRCLAFGWKAWAHWNPGKAMAKSQILQKSGEIDMADLQQLEESIVGLSLLEAAELVKKLESRLGVSAAAAAPGWV